VMLMGALLSSPCCFLWQNTRCLWALVSPSCRARAEVRWSPFSCVSPAESTIPSYGLHLLAKQLTSTIDGFEWWSGDRQRPTSIRVDPDGQAPDVLCAQGALRSLFRKRTHLYIGDLWRSPAPLGGRFHQSCCDDRQHRVSVSLFQYTKRSCEKAPGSPITFVLEALCGNGAFFMARSVLGSRPACGRFPESAEDS
jgi:hypothetical protein